MAAAPVISALPPAAGTVSWGLSINASGIVAGESGEQATWWTESGGGYTSALLPPLSPFIESSIGAVNDNGQIVGISGYQLDASATLWTNAGSEYVPTDLQPPGSTDTYASNISNSGIIAGSEFVDGRGSHAALWAPTSGGHEFRDLSAALPTNALSVATGVNDHGTTIGRYALPDDNIGAFGFYRAFVLRGATGSAGEATLVDLHALGGGTRSSAVAINGEGDVLGAIDSQLGIWEETGGSYNFIPLTGSGAGGEAIADDGTVVGQISIPAFPRPISHAALWLNDAQHTLVDLDAWLDSVDPAEGSKWTLNTAEDINVNGLVVGLGIFNDGAGGLPDGPRGFVLNVQSVPEPVSMLPLVIAGAVAGAQRARSRKRR